MRKQYIEDINKENINKVISIDECGFNCFNKKQKACSLIGTNVHVPIDQVKHKNQSLLMAITTNNILYSDLYVSHLSFYKQNETGINLDKLIDNYNELYITIEENGHFK